MRFQGRCFRAHDPRWAFDPVSGEGARIRGGRFNPQGKPALYLSLRIETAIGECSQGFSRRIPPLTICEYEVDCDPVADLSGEEVRAEHKVSLEALECPWLDLMLMGKPVPSHKAAQGLEMQGYVGVIVPSFFPGARPSDLNLVLWSWSDRRPNLVQVHDPESRLPRDGSSWA